MDHKYDVPLDDVRTTEPPEQNVVLPLAVMVAVALTVTVVGAEVAEHPLLLVTVTV